MLRLDGDTAPYIQIDHTFPAMGCEIRIGVTARAALRDDEDLRAAVHAAEALVHACAARLTRFDPGSELNQLSADPAPTVAVSPLLARAVDLAIVAARHSGGRLDPTLLPSLEAAGYADHWSPERRLALSALLAAAPPRSAARASTSRAWEQISVDLDRRRITRPPGLRIDVAATAKGLIADLALRALGPVEHAFVDAGGDLALAGAPMDVLAEDPFGGAPLRFRSPGPCGIATSSIAGRCWWDDDVGPSHHLLDPATGRPAFTGVVQATAIAPSAAEAEGLAGLALLSGPAAGARVLQRFGGFLVLDDGSTVPISAGAHA